jgi:uncharacterized protein (TIGR02001 family)
MKKLIIPAALAVAFAAAPAAAADLGKAVTKAPAPAPAPSPWDIAIGGVVTSDYNFRGVSQSNRGPSGGAYFEPQLTVPFGTLYAGVAGYAIDWPTAYGFTSPSAEVDIYGGWRNSWGPFSADIGVIYYYYPKETFNGLTNDSDFWEIYGKFAYELVKDTLTVGANVFYSPDVLHYSKTFATLATLGLGSTGDATGTYVSGTLKWVTPWKYNDVGAYVSGELGHWFLNKNPFIAAGLTDPSYTYWNVGLAFTYKALTLDLRYHGNDMSATTCGSFLLTGVPNPANSWCKDTFIVSGKFDTTLNALK